MDKELPSEEIALYTRHMRGKSDEEKELLAEQFVKELQEKG